MDLIHNNLLRVVDAVDVSSLWQDDQKRTRLCLGIACSFVKYLVIYKCLRRLLKDYIVHKAVPKINRIRLVNAVWRVIFSVGVFTMFIIIPWDTFNPQSNIFLSIIESMRTPHCNVTLQQHHFKNASSLEFSLLIAPVAFFVHQIYVSISEGLEPPVVSMGCCAMFVIAADPVKCPNLSILVFLLLSLSMGSLELAKVVYALKSRCRGFEGPPAPLLIRLVIAPFLFLLHIAACAFCTVISFHWGSTSVSVAWFYNFHDCMPMGEALEACFIGVFVAMVNFYLLPVLFLSLPSVTQVDAHSRFTTAYINIFLLFLFWHQFFDLPVWSLLKLVVKRPTERRRMRSLLSLPAVVLLPYTSSLLPELRAIQMNFLLNALPTSAERRMIRKKILSSGSQTSTPISEEKADFRSFIKCVKILKRKMRFRYEQNMSNEASVQSGSNEFETDSEHQTEESGGHPESDVTDIYVPVPSNSCETDNNLISQHGINLVSPSLEKKSNCEKNDQPDETKSSEECLNSESDESEDNESSKT